ncbi:hypothetical protein [Fimbriiglobus ruber]|uniref:Uncharacterized protein n=1 Tax=Fimbriiglobus ruber TaxID=1908690 RepID=A0A225DI56_9BACT|nr:hypothetical protein [Fimbriiglobus ruber]OWK38238.1 hypothetical protein FRUB_07358 [Fimbriiglobus ruber]
MIRRVACYVATAILISGLAGCGGGKADRGINKDADRPKSPGAAVSSRS